MFKKLIIGIIPVFIGGLIYLTYRSESLLIFGWFKKIGLYSIVDFLRNNEFINHINLPYFVKYNLPAGLWLFSFIYLICIIINFDINKQSIFLIIIVILIGLFSELGQLMGLLSGTFDIYDLLILILASIIPFIICKLSYNK